MDIQRPASVARNKKFKQMAFAVAGLLVLTWGAMRVVRRRNSQAARRLGG